MATTTPIDLTERVSVEAQECVAGELSTDPLIRSEVLRLGLREWKMCKALDAYRRREGTLAYAAHRAGISLWEIGAVAYAHGLSPDLDSRALEGEATLERASFL